MRKRKAVYYGEMGLIPDVICDGYVLDDNSAVMSERGTADLLGVHHYSLQSMANNGTSKTLRAFADKSFTMRGNFAEECPGMANN